MKITVYITCFLLVVIFSFGVFAQDTEVAVLDLGSYPEPFVKENILSSFVIVGERASSSDVIGASNVVARLSQGGVCIESDLDTFKIETPEYHFLGTSTMSGLVDQVGGDNLDVLKPGVMSVSSGDFAYKQYIKLPATGVSNEVDPDDPTDWPKVYTKYNNRAFVYSYSVEFEEPLAVENDANDELAGLEEEDIVLLGKTLTFVDTDHTAQNNIVLTLMRGPVQDTLNEGETKTYILDDGNDYEVSLDFVGTDSVKFIVNGEKTAALNVGDIRKVAGIQLGVGSILSQQYASGIKQAKFFLGADKIVLKDTNIGDHSHSHELKVGEENIDGTSVTIIGSDEGVSNGDVVNIEQILINFTADDTYYVPEGGSLLDKVDDKDAIFLQGFDFLYTKMDLGNPSDVWLEPQSISEYKMTFTNKNGETITFPVFGYENNGYFMGEDSSPNKDLIVNENSTINDEDYFIISSNDISHVLRYRSISTSDNTLKFEDLATGEEIEIIYDEATIGDDGGIDGYFNMDGYQYGVAVQANDADVRVDLDSDGTVENGSVVTFTTQAGSVVRLNDTSNRSFTVTSKDKETDFSAAIYVALGVNVDGMDVGKKDVMEFAVGWNSDNSELRLNATAFKGLEVALTQLDDMEISQGADLYGTVVVRDYTSDQDTLRVITYDQELFFDMRVVAGGTTAQDIINAESGGTTCVKGSIDLGSLEISKLDSDITAEDKENRNLVLVGGPCANDLVAELALKNNTRSCEEWLSGDYQGEAIIQLVDNAFIDGKYALLVAGLDAKDTRRASYALQNYQNHISAMAGKTQVNVKGESVTSPIVS